MSKLFTKTSDQGNKLYFFTRVEYGIDIKKLKKDFSDKEEKLEGIGIYDIKDIMEIDGDDIYIVCDKEETIEDDEAAEIIPPGFYNVGRSNSFGEYLIESDPSIGDKYIELGGVFDTIQTTIQRFYDKEETYRELDMLHKMGILLYGPPGNGKSMLIRELVKSHIKDSVVIFIDDEFPKQLIGNLKNFPANYIFVFEEMTHILEQHGGLAKLLLFLDGEYSLDKQLVLATTNYPEALPENLASRPSRFDKVIEVGNPDDETRREYLKTMIEGDVEEIVEMTQDMSIAYLKEIVISSKVSGEDIKKVINENRLRIKTVQKNFAPSSEKKIGLF